MSESSQNTPAEDEATNVPETFSCKIIQNSVELPKSSRDWTRAKRCRITFAKEGLEYLDTFTPYADITKATIHIYPSAFFFEYGIFSITTSEFTHHFGIKYSDYWKEDLPLSVERITEETPFILFRKSLIILILIYIFWEVVKK